MSPQNGVMSPQNGVMSPQNGVMSPQEAEIGRAVVATGALIMTGLEAVATGVTVGVEALLDAACACTARSETPAMAARAMEPLRFEILRDMTCFLWSE
jgi:hypothetical protein